MIQPKDEFVVEIGKQRLRVLDYARVSYEQGLAQQRAFVEQVIAGEPAEHVLMLLEHDPVVTVPPKQSAQAHLVASPAQLKRLGIEVCETDRGGDITYHGPGQLVAYPILKLSTFNLNLSKYMRLLEQMVIQTLAAYGVAGHREQGATGVWVDPQHFSIDAPSGSIAGAGESGARDADGLLGVTEKICAMGVRIRKNTTLHGIGFNLSTDLSHFQTIVPCGLAGRPVTSLTTLLGENAPSMRDLKRTLTGCLADQLESAIAAK